MVFVIGKFIVGFSISVEIWCMGSWHNCMMYDYEQLSGLSVFLKLFNRYAMIPIESTTTFDPLFIQEVIVDTMAFLGRCFSTGEHNSVTNPVLYLTDIQGIPGHGRLV